MTSGEFTRIPVNKIWVARGERQRKELKEIPELADDIKRNGLINPIVIDRDYKVCTGERRFEAIKLLGHDFVMCQWFDELSPARQREIELAENIKRINLSWQEQCDATVEYNSIRVSEDPKWTHEDTAKALGLHESFVSDCFLIKKAFRKDPSIMSHPALSTAKGIVQREQERRAESQLQGVFSAPEEKKIQSIIHTDFLEWAPTYTGPKFNFLHIDFPYGIDTDERGQGNAVDIQGGYDDSAANYWRLLACLCRHLNNFCTDSAHIMFWFSMHYYADTLNFFARNSDFTIDPFPLVWMKSDGRGMLPDPQRGPRRIYETCLFGARGDRKIVGSVGNAYAAPTESNKIHISIKPEPMLRHFFRMFVDENSTLLDPTCGSGSALRAAESMEAAFVLGLDSNAQFVEDATLELERFRRLRKATV